MSEPTNTNTIVRLENLETSLLSLLQEVRSVKAEIQKNANGNHEGDHLLDAEEASIILSVSPDWLYRNSSKLPFTRKLGPKMLRFSYQGIQKWLATRKPS